MNNPKPYHLTITSNETGEVIRDMDFDALIGAAHIDERHAVGIAVNKCPGRALAETLNTAEAIVDKHYKDHPELLLLQMALSVKSCEVEENPTEGGENETV